MTEHVCDVAIIGAGTAGLSAERSARRNGGTTRLIDPYFAGTTCATVGCMPSKLLIAAGEAAHRARKTDTFGVHTGEVAIDGPAVMRRVRELRDHFVSATKDSFDDLPEDTCIEAHARFIGTTTLALDNGDTVQARSVVIATGSGPARPGPFDELGDLVLTNQTVFELEDLPRTLGVVGGGAIGLELAQAFSRLGTQVTLFDSADALGGVEDEEAQAALQQIMRDEFAIHLGVEVSGERADGGARLTWSGKSEGKATFERVLLAVGRPPNLDSLDLAQAGLTLDDDGMPQFDAATTQCGDAPIFMAGDCNGYEPVLHQASDEGAIAGRNAVAYPAIVHSERTPTFRITFTDPPVAIVGTVDDADAIAGCASYADQGRATVEARAKGLVKLYARQKCGSLVGATLVAPGADHMAHLLLWSLMQELTINQIQAMPRYHPTLEEGLAGALKQLCANVGSPLPGDQDEGNPPGA